MGCGSHRREGASVRGNSSFKEIADGSCEQNRDNTHGSKCKVIIGTNLSLIFSKFWEYAGLVEQCPRFASPDRIHEKLVIDTVRAKIESLLVRIIFECELNRWKR